MKGNSPWNKEVGRIIKNAIKNSKYSSKEIAEKLGIAPPSLCQMLSGKSPLPFNRFGQLIQYLPLTRNDFSFIFQVYKTRYGIPDDVFNFTQDSFIQKRKFEILSIPENERSEFNKIELEVIEHWLNENCIKSEDENTQNPKIKLMNMINNLSKYDAERALTILQTIFEEF